MFSERRRRVISLILYVLLALGERLLTQYELNTERRIQQTCEDLVEKERRRLEKEYREQSEELIRSWKAKLEEEKENLQRVRKRFINFNENLFARMFRNLIECWRRWNECVWSAIERMRKR